MSDELIRDGFMAPHPSMPMSPKKPVNWAAVTIASQRFLPLARVTARSFREHNPSVPFYLVLADENQPAIDESNEPFRLLQFHELEIPEADRFRFQHDELELSYATTPFAIRHILTLGHAKVLFLKQETLVLGPLSELMDSLEGHSALLTPHFLEPLEREDALQWELNVLRAGVFNGGVVGFADTPEAQSFLTWWGERTASGCYRDIPRGLHFEQRWLDYATSLLPHCHICRDPGVNVGHWNLPERKITVHADRVSAGSTSRQHWSRTFAAFVTPVATSPTGISTSVHSLGMQPDGRLETNR